jgi:hypothetical protein
MSARGRGNAADKEVARLRAELDALKTQARVADAEIAASGNAGAEFDALSPVEQSAASLGVNPAGYRPISFMNQAHFDQLKSANMLSDDLARRIEVSPATPVLLLCAFHSLRCFARRPSVLWLAAEISATREAADLGRRCVVGGGWRCEQRLSDQQGVDVAKFYIRIYLMIL